VVIYFCFPETKGFSLEELSLLFEDSANVEIVGLERGEAGSSVEKQSIEPSIVKQ